MIFSMDVLIAFLLIVGMLYIMILHFNLFEEQIVNEIDDFTLMKNAVMISDSLVKNCEKGIGLAKLNFSSRRCLSNELISGTFSDFNYFKNTEVFVKKIGIEFKNSEQMELFAGNGNEDNDCVSSERFVYFEGRKAKLNLVICNE